MSLLGRLAHDALASHEGVVSSARARLDKELRPVATGAWTWRLVPVAQLMGTGEAMTESLRTLLGSGKIRVDRVLYTQVPTARGTLEVAIPFSGKDTLAPQFSLRLSVAAPAGALLQRSAMGSWGFGDWVASQGFQGSPAAQALCERLKAADVSDGVEWNCELPGDYVWKLGWTLQLVPSGAGQSRLLMQSGRVGILFTRFGVDIFLKKAEQSLAVLQGLSSFPEAPPSPIEECWADRVAPLLTQNPGLGLGGQPVTGAPGAQSSGLRPAPDDLTATLKTRGTIAAVLSAVTLPLCIAPLGLVGGGLALHTRSLAAKQGLPAPISTLVALVLSGISLLFFAVTLVAVAVAPDGSTNTPQAAATTSPDPQVQVRLGGGEQPRTAFRIVKVYQKHQPSTSAPFHTSGGEWTYFDAALEDDDECRFTMGLSSSKSAGGFGFAKAKLSVADEEAADCLVDSLALDFDVDLPAFREGPVKGPLALNVAVLGQHVARGKQGGFSGKGSWVATKLFLEKEEQSAEVFFNFDLESRQGEFSEKDADSDQPMVDILAASLRVEGPAKRQAHQKKH